MSNLAASASSRSSVSSLSIGATKLVVLCVRAGFVEAERTSRLEVVSHMIETAILLLRDRCGSLPTSELPDRLESDLEVLPELPPSLLRPDLATFPRRFACPTIDLLNEIASAVVEGCSSTGSGWILRGSVVRNCLDSIAMGDSLV